MYRVREGDQIERNATEEVRDAEETTLWDGVIDFILFDYDFFRLQKVQKSVASHTWELNHRSKITWHRRGSINTVADGRQRRRCEEDGAEGEDGGQLLE